MKYGRIPAEKFLAYRKNLSLLGTFPIFQTAPSLLGMVENFAQNIENFEVKFDEIRAFEPRVLFASPVKNSYLERLNILIHEKLLKCFPAADNEYYTPTKWIPHCALAVRLDIEQF